MHILQCYDINKISGLFYLTNNSTNNSKMNHQQQYFNFNNFSLTSQSFYPIPKHSPKPDTNNNASVEETFSRKVFVGGLPLSVMEYEIKQHFEK